MNKKNLVLWSVVVVIVILTSCCVVMLMNQDKISANNPLVLTDTMGKEVKLTKVPERIISLIPAATETIYELGVGDLLVAIDTFSNYPADTSTKTKLLTGSTLNLEQIVLLRPDVVLMSKMAQTEEQYLSLVNAGITVVMVDASSLEEMYTMTRLIGKVVRKEQQANEMISWMQNEFKTLQNSVQGKETKKVYYEISPLEYGLWTAGNNTFEYEIMTLLNITNVFNDVSGWGQVSQEQVLTKNPDIIITTSLDTSNLKAVDEILNRANWQQIEAIKSKQVYQINADLITRPSKRLVEGAKELKKLVYGE